MSVKAFLELVEIRTKLASLFPFCVGALYAYYAYGQFYWLNTLIFFAAMFIFDMTTTAINNFMDYRKAVDPHYKHEVNIVGRDNLSNRQVISLILGMLVVATSLSIWLVFRTNILLLPIGALCFFIGIFYTFGPVPLSRLPLGELFSGVTMGFGILFITIYVNCYDLSIVTFLLNFQQIKLGVNIPEFLALILVSVPTMFTIANIMLANNLCDMAEDRRNRRSTLPLVIGHKWALILYNTLIVGSISAVFLAVILRIYPLTALAVILVIPVVIKQTKQFNREQVKAKTFSTSLKNLVLINGAQIVGLLTGILIKG